MTDPVTYPLELVNSAQPCENCDSPVVVMTFNILLGSRTTNLYEVEYGEHMFSVITTTHTPARCRALRRKEEMR